MNFSLTSNGPTIPTTAHRRATPKPSHQFPSNYASTQNTDLTPNTLFESNPKSHPINLIDEYSELLYRKDNALPAKFPDLFSYGAERIDYYDE